MTLDSSAPTTKESQRYTPSPSPRYLPSDLQRLGRLLLNQQCWLWGQDIKRPEGNLLLQRGFERVRPPAGETGSSQYTIKTDSGLTIRLWGFGFYCGREAGIYLNRYEFIPRMSDSGDLWRPKELSRMPRSADRSLLPRALRWMGDYEAWVRLTQGTSYRHKCLAGWNARAGAPAVLPVRWRQLADRIERTAQSNVVLSRRSFNSYGHATTTHSAFATLG